MLIPTMTNRFQYYLENSTTG